jgi:hypothetical protein
MLRGVTDQTELGGEVAFNARGTYVGAYGQKFVTDLTVPADAPKVRLGAGVPPVRLGQRDYEYTP